MKLIFICFLTVISQLVLGSEIRYQLEPSRPIVDEPFRLILEIDTQERGEPFISFTPGEVEVLGRSDLGVSMQTTIIGGQMSSKRIYRYAYDLMAKRAGTVRLTNLSADINGSKIRGPDIAINVLRERAAPKPFFVQAEVSKNEAYVGEGINLDYYLYFRVSILGLEILDFPKLNNFIKRFYMTSDHHETVEFDGTVYRRRKAYSARVYPETTGELKVDPIQLRIQYSDRVSGGFGGFGFGNVQSQTRTLRSDLVTINVKPLPAEGVPKNFTGLVGEHKFRLEVPRDKFVTNEVVDVRLEVEGPGALENMSAPIIYDDKNLEVFDTKSEFRETSEASAKKTFNYTFIARGPLADQSPQVEFSYFDAIEGVYRQVSVTRPKITISATTNVAVEPEPLESTSQNTPVASIPSFHTKLNAPYFFVPTSIKSMKNLSAFVSLFALLGIILICLSILLKREQQTHGLVLFQKIEKEIKKNGINYNRVYKLLSLFQDDFENIGPQEALKRLNLPKETQTYFSALVNIAERETYAQGRGETQLNFDRRHFKILRKAYRELKNG